MTIKTVNYFLLLLVFCGVLFQPFPAGAQLFDDIENKTGTQVAKLVKQYNWKFIFTPEEAKTPRDFDRLSNIRIDGSRATIYATCASYYRVKDYSNQRVKNRATIYDAMADFDGSPIKAEFRYQTTTTPFMNGIIVKQSIRPGQTINSDVYKINAPPEQKKISWKKPSLIQTNPNSYTNYSTPPKTSEKIIIFDAYKMPPVVMPDLTNMTYEAAIAKISRDHIPVIYTQPWEEETSIFEKNNIVFFQSTKPGTIVSKNIMLGLKYYKFKGATQVPDVSNITQAEAVNLIKKANLTPKIKYISLSEKYPDKGPGYYSVKDFLGKTVGQTPLKGTSAASGSAVEITVLKANETIMPNVTGMTYAEAENLIINYRRQLYYVYVKTGKDNIISSSEPKAGQTLKTFDTIKVTIQRTVPIIPNIIGMTEAQATAELKKHGLNVTHRKLVPIPQLKNGQVFTIWPVPGVAIVPDTIVTLTIVDNDSVVLPTVTHRTPEQAGKILKENGYNNYVIDYKDIDKSNETYYNAYKNSIGLVESVLPDKQQQVVPQETRIHLIVLRWAPVEVPLLSGMSEVGALARLKDKGLLANITYTTTNLVDYNGKVLGGQTPKPYTKVPEGSIVSFNVVAYKINMPTVLHLSESEAVEKLAALGLKTKISYEDTNISSSAGRIKEQKPNFREKVDSGSTIELVVYKFSGMVTVPNLIYHELNNTIIKTLTDKKLKYHIIEQKTVLTTQLNKIFKTQPAYPQKTMEGSTITIYIYKKLEAVPNVVGKTEADATYILESTGFSVKKYYIEGVTPGMVSIQTQKAGNAPTHAAITLGIGKVNIKAPMANMILSQPSNNALSQIKEFYTRFKEAYESKDEYQVVSLISADWGSNDGNSISDLEDNLHNMFGVFDEIQYNITGLDIQPDQTDTYRISYAVTITGTIYDSNITHNEKSSVQELVKIENGKVQIVKTLNGNFWSIE